MATNYLIPSITSLSKKIVESTIGSGFSSSVITSNVLSQQLAMKKAHLYMNMVVYWIWGIKKKIVICCECWYASSVLTAAQAKTSTLISSHFLWDDFSLQTGRKTVPDPWGNLSFNYIFHLFKNADYLKMRTIILCIQYRQLTELITLPLCIVRPISKLP